ncbi:MAG TPA: cell envelope integrity protein CreD [Thermoanaerobaculia bacterium]|nr:cell envelope integrity protein CreD [Thermoanaerobaculia bacterium]
MDSPISLMNPQDPRQQRKSSPWKLLVISLLILLLWIPLLMVRSLIRERQHRRDTVVESVAQSWGRGQTLGGPVLTVPYLVRTRDARGLVTTVRQLAYFLPETLRVEGTVAPERRSRGIFEVVVYRADLRWAGTFARPSFASWSIPPDDILWDEAFLTVGVPDMRGIRRGTVLHWQGRPLPLEPGGGEAGLWGSGLRVAVPDLAPAALAAAPEVGTTEEPEEPYAFRFDLSLDGSGQLSFLPFGKQTTVTLRSSWRAPSFIGAFLPETRKVGTDGFQAVWNVAYFGRSYPQQWRSPDTEQVAPQYALQASTFGVDLYLPVDVYQKSERSVKYGLLFLVLTFLTFFLYEVFSPFSLHPVQYLLVGAALCLFYLLLLSISEHVPFGTAYAVASAATIALIGGYSLAILRGKLRALAMSGVLALLYGYLYVLLQSEDFALLLGSIGLFLILGLVMFVTREIDWYGTRPEPLSPTSPPPVSSMESAR